MVTNAILESEVPGDIRAGAGALRPGEPDRGLCPPLRRQWDQCRDGGLVVAIAGIFLRGDRFSHAERRNEEQGEPDEAQARPVHPFGGRRDPEQVEHPPHADFAEIVGMAALSEQPGGDERTGDILPGRDPPFLVLLEVPHLPVGNRFANK